MGAFAAGKHAFGLSDSPKACLPDAKAPITLPYKNLIEVLQ